MNRNVFYIQCLLITAFYFLGFQSVYAQPGESAFSMVIFDGSGYHTNFKIYSCSVNYPNKSLRSDSLELVWKPDVKTIKIIDTLQLVMSKNDNMEIPYPFYYQGKSCLATNILMIIRDNKDSMLISTAGGDACKLLVAPYHKEPSLPLIFPFQKGLFFLQKLIANRSTKSLYFSIYRNYFLSSTNKTNSTIILNPADVSISYLKMSRQTYSAGDTISITLTGSVLNDGACAGGSILWTLQKFENKKWITVIDHCCEQMDCGVGPSIFNNTTIPLILIKDKNNTDLKTFPQQRVIEPGKYRFVIYDEFYQPYFTDEFNIK